jgi:hypothetical protein
MSHIRSNSRSRSSGVASSADFGMRASSNPANEFPRALDDRVVIGFAGGYSLRVDLAVARRQAVVRSPLENRQLLCLLSDLRDSLHRAGAGA